MLPAQPKFSSSEQNLRIALMYMPIPIGVTNTSGGILLLNEAFLVTFGYSVDELDSVDEWMLRAYPDPDYRAHVMQTWSADLAVSLKVGLPTPRREYRVTTKSGDVKRMMIMMRKVDELMFTTFEDVTQRRQNEEMLAQYRSKLENLAYNDQLLNIPNRHRFSELVDRLIQQPASHTVALLDIDDFSSINNALGHQFGDQILSTVAQCLIDCLPNDVILARVSSDCFGIAGLDRYITPDTLSDIFKSPLPVKNEMFTISVTMGLIRLSQPDSSGSEVIKNAELALRQAKSTHRGKALYFTSDMITQSEERMRLLVGLRSAFVGNQLFVLYQPQVALSDDRVIGMEALIRWRTGNGEIIRPDQFIPLAEQTGLIVPIGDFVLRTSLHYLRELHLQGLNHLCMSVNVSIIQLREPGFYSSLRMALLDTEVDPKFVELEITESTAMSDLEFIKTVLAELRDLGVSVAIDDFGTGHSSLGVLRELPIQRLKIDKSFIDQIEVDSNDCAIVQMIISLAKQLELEVIAEGVETKQQKELLLKMGCNQGQGYLFARPLDSSQLEKWMLVRTATLKC